MTYPDIHVDLLRLGTAAHVSAICLPEPRILQCVLSW